MGYQLQGGDDGGSHVGITSGTGGQITFGDTVADNKPFYVAAGIAGMVMLAITLIMVKK